MIQLQIRIEVKLDSGDIVLTADALERKDANSLERRIAGVFESVHRKVFRLIEGDATLIGDLDDCLICRDIGRVVCPGCIGEGNGCARCNGDRVLPCPACNAG